MGDALTVTVRSEHGVVIAAVTGEIDISTVAPLRDACSSWRTAGRR